MGCLNYPSVLTAELGDWSPPTTSIAYNITSQHANISSHTVRRIWGVTTQIFKLIFHFKNIFIFIQNKA